MIELLLPSFFLIIALVAIHTLFGMEIISRGIIFTDLAIGQSAAVGTAVALLWFSEDFIYPISLSFAIAAGLWISFLSRKKYKEASIGLLYALSFSLIFIIMSNSPEGTELFLNLTAADIIFTPVAEIVMSAVLYLVVALLFIFIVKKMPQSVKRDIAFFSLFAVTVTNSVHVAGVLVVFILLIAPAFMAMVFHQGYKTAVLMGVLVSFLALIGSYLLDLPTGHALVAMLSLASLLAITFKKEDS